MDPGRLLGGTHSAPGQPQVPTVCLWSLMLFDVLAVLSVISVPRVCMELTPRTTRTKQALSHGRRSSVIVHRSSFIVHRSVLIRRTESSCFKLSIVYRLSGILRSYAPYAPYGPGCLPTYQPHTRPSAADIATLQSLLCNRLSTSTSTSTSTSVPARLISGAQGYHDTGEEKTGGRAVGSGSEKARRREGPGERKTDGEGGYGTRENTELTLTLRGRRAQEIGCLFESSRPGLG